MHIYFIGIGGAGIGPLALIARQAGYNVSGSDQKESEYTRYLQKKGLILHIDQSAKAMAAVHKKQPIEWVVSVSSVTRLNPNHPELVFARENGIRITERDECLNEILARNNLSMIAAAGTHGKTTTTAMIIWALQELGEKVSYSVGAKTSFADMGHYEPGSKYFIYECDEFHRNFLKFKPAISVICGIAWDHHEVFPTQEDYNSAFREFISQSSHTYIWDRDAQNIGISASSNITVVGLDNNKINETMIAGEYNRQNAWLVIQAVSALTGSDQQKIQDILSKFPGTQRRMEEIIPNIFSDYAHTPEKIIGCLSVAKEIAEQRGLGITVIYEPLTNRRQHYIKEYYATLFKDVDALYWVPSYLSREDPAQEVLTPIKLLEYCKEPAERYPAELNQDLWDAIRERSKSTIVICMTGGGAESLDEWLRAKALETH